MTEKEKTSLACAQEVVRGLDIIRSAIAGEGSRGPTLKFEDLSLKERMEAQVNIVTEIYKELVKYVKLPDMLHSASAQRNKVMGRIHYRALSNLQDFLAQNGWSEDECKTVTYTPSVKQTPRHRLT